MEAVLLADAPTGDVFTAGSCAVAADQLSARGATVTSFDVHAIDLALCIGCFDCWGKTPGRCRFRDDGDDIARAIVQADLVVLVGPVLFGGYSSGLKRVMDRMLPTLSPMLARQDGEIYRLARYRRPASLVAIGTLPEPDPETERTFRGMVERNALHLHAPAYGVTVLEGSMPTTEVRLAVQGAFAAVDHAAATPRARPPRGSRQLTVRP